MKPQNNNIPCWQCRYGADPGHMEQCSCPQVQNLSLVDLLPDESKKTMFLVGKLCGTADQKKMNNTFNPAIYGVVSKAVGEGNCKYFEPMPDGSKRNAGINN